MARALTFSLLFAFVAAACGGGTAPPSATAPPTASPAAAAKATCPAKTVKLAMPVTPPNVVHLPPYVAVGLGYFKEENLDVEIIRFEGGVGSLRSAAAGGVDMAGSSSEPIITAISQGAEVRVVYTYSPVISVAFAVRENIKTAADLKGKKIGIQDPNGFADFMSRAVLRKEGVDPKDVQFVQTTTAGRVTQLIEGTVDTGVLHVDQVLAIQKRAPGVHVLANMWEVLPDYLYAAFVVNTSVLKSDPATVECMVRAIARGNRAMYDPALRAKVIEIGMKETKIDDRPLFEKALDTLIAAKAWPQNEALPRKNVEGSIASLKSLNQLGKDLKFDDVVDLSVANKVVAQLGKRADWPY